MSDRCTCRRLTVLRLRLEVVRRSFLGSAGAGSGMGATAVSSEYFCAVEILINLGKLLPSVARSLCISFTNCGW